jgi:sec-independent protein translocase protein TatA
MRGILEPEHLLLILLVVLVLFGGKKIPELAGGLGKGIKEFKRGMEGINEPGGQDVGTGAAPRSLAGQDTVARSAASQDEERAPKRLIG